MAIANLECHTAWVAPVIRTLALIGLLVALTGCDDSARDSLPARRSEIQATFLGTSTLLFDDGTTKLLIDPFLTRPPLTALRRPIATDPRVVDDALARAGATCIDAIFVSHAHYDHALDLAYIAIRTGARVHGSASALNVARGGNVPEARLTLYLPGREVRVGDFHVQAIPSKHSPPLLGLNDDLGQAIAQPLPQPASYKSYKEGGSFDILIRHGSHTILVKSSANYVPDAFEGVRADVVFLAVPLFARLAPDLQRRYYENTVRKVQPRLVVPIHWDNFMQPLSDQLRPLGGSSGMEYMRDRVKSEGLRYERLQGFQTISFFDDGRFAVHASKPRRAAAP